MAHEDDGHDEIGDITVEMMEAIHEIGVRRNPCLQCCLVNVALHLVKIIAAESEMAEEEVVDYLRTMTGEEPAQMH